jgi:Carboxypeptidase regulatory-like domain
MRRFLMLSLIPVVLLPTRLFAQSVRVAGVVQDQSGASIPNATVMLRKGTETRTTVTNITGSFSFDRVSPGTYEIQADQPGFKTGTARVVVGNRAPRPVEFKLQIANLQQEVTVGGDDIEVSTQTDSNLDVAALDRNALDNAPIFDQNYIATISRFLDSGAIGTGGTTLIMDGLQVNNISLPASAIQEVKINQNPYSPEFLRPGRGRIEVVTKAAASAYHGSLNFVFRDNRLNAREPFAAEKPQEQRRILEASLTGPLGAGKTTSFLFAGTYQSDDAQSIVFANASSGAFRANVPNPQRDVDLSARISHQFGAKNTVSLRYESLDQYRKNQGVGGVNLPEVATNFRNREDTFTYTQTTTFTPKLINEFRILFGKEYQPIRSVHRGPKIVVLDAFTGGGAQADRLQTEYHTTLHDALAWSHGKHTFRTGVDVPDISRRGLEDSTNFQGTFNFSSLDDYRQNHPFSFIQQAGQGKVIFWEKVVAGFFLDDIKVRPNLTVSVAARYDWQNYFHDNNNVSPRIAFAFSPAGHPKTVIRGGAGVFYDRTGPQPIFDLLRYDGQRLLQYVVTNPGFPNPWLGLQPQASPSAIVRLAPDVRIPYLMQFGIGVERQLQKSTTLTINYTGGDTVGVFRSRDVNAPLPPLYGGRPDPDYSVVRQIESSGRLESHSLEIGVRGDVTRYFSGLMQYTLGHAYNNTGGINAFPANNYALSGEWGRADFDQRHRFNLLGTIKPGKLFNLGVGVFLNTGRPYSLTTGHDDYHVGSATARPPGVGRNTLQGPGYAEYDLRWFRDFKLAQPRNEVAPTITVSVDAFNMLNHVNYTGYIGTLSSPFFGRAVSAQPPRRLQFSTRFAF